MTSMNCSPDRIRPTFSSSNTRSVPGSPSAAPVMTTGSGSAAASPFGDDRAAQPGAACWLAQPGPAAWLNPRGLAGSADPPGTPEPPGSR
jgi:hypothetical protein